MQIILTKTSGFCMGVKRALAIALKISKEKNEKIYTLGPLIHNAQVISFLGKRDIVPLKEIPKGKSKTIIIRAHGIEPKLLNKLEHFNHSICDATCPKVRKLQDIVSDYSRNGYLIVIFGDKNHAEVKGLVGRCNGNYIVLKDYRSINKIPKTGKICLVSQTTQLGDNFKKLAHLTKLRNKNTTIFNTICESTHKRQAEVLELTKKADIILVIGDKKSANTKRLYELSKKSGVKTYLIETPKSITQKMLKGHEIIGISAGASTPDWIIKDAIKQLLNLKC